MYSAVIVAAGSGSRFGQEQLKVLALLKNRPVISYSLERFRADPDCREIILVHPQNNKHDFQPFCLEKVTLVKGGSTRQESVLNGLNHVTQPWVLIHDGARPNVSLAVLDRVKQTMEKNAVAPAIGVKDTLKQSMDGLIIGDIPRHQIYHIQTPQGFPTALIRKAHEKAMLAGHQYSDDTSVFQHELGLSVSIVEGDEENIKVTTPTDIKILEAII
jgi:2-C-methyl-D-erythritol 4-phosphate cytidylyltransferase